MDSSWETTDWWINDDVGEGLGTLLKINPVEGLSLGVGAYLISQEGSGRNNQLGRGIPGHTLKAEDSKYVFGASYTLKDTFYLGASFRTQNQAGDDDLKTNTGRQESSQLIGDLRIFAIKKLTAVIAYSFNNLYDFNNSGAMIFSESLGFNAADDLNIGLNAVQFISNKEEHENSSMLFNLWGSYAIDKIVPRLDLTYYYGGNSHAANYHRRGYQDPVYDYDCSVFSIRPSVKINIDNRTHLEIGNVTHLNNPNDDLKAANVFYVDFKWNF